jgi:RNA polymerase sigma-70 factor, ECF subfamily
MSYLTVSAERVQRAIEGDAHALDHLVRVSLRPVLDWCIRLGGPGLDADDLAHDVLILVLRKLPTLRAPDRYAPWLFMITRREVLRRRRREKARRWVPLFDREQQDPGGGPCADLELSETSRQVFGLLDRLPEAQRTALVLVDVEGRSAAEAATLLGVPPGTVKSRLRLGRQRFLTMAQREGLARELAEVARLGTEG